MRSAAGQEDCRAQYYLGTFYYQGVGMPVDRVTAAQWFRLSAENGFPDAQLAYGMVLLSGDGVPLDKAQAIGWLTKAANQNNAKAREVVRELLTYRGQPVSSPLSDQSKAPEKMQNENQLRLEGKGVLLDQGTFGLKFSLPTLYDAYASNNLRSTSPIWDRLQGGVLDVIIRPPK
jgi:TPR repeat protein